MLLQRLAHGHMPTVVAFDLDGTLVNSLPDLACAIDLMLGDLNLAPAGENQVRQWVGNGATVLVERALKHNSPEKPVSKNQLSRAMNFFFGHYWQHCAKRTHLYSGALHCLDQLHKRHINMSIVTNKHRQFVQPVLRHLAIDHFFSLVVAGDDLLVTKPQPQPLQFCLDYYQTSVESAVVVGDSRNDTIAARRANIAVAAVDYGYNHGQSVSAEKPDAVISSLIELLQ